MHTGHCPASWGSVRPCSGRHRSLFAGVVILALLMELAACGSTASSDSTPGAGGAGGAGGAPTGPCATGGAGGSGAGGAGGAGTGPLTGVVHWPTAADATNASIDDGGKLRWSVFGCDFCWEQEAQWEAVGDTVVIKPKAGETTMDWTDDVGLLEGITEVHMTRGSGGDVLVEVLDGVETLLQTWSVGRACAYCCGHDGPFGHYACPGPLPLQSCAP